MEPTGFIGTNTPPPTAEEILAAVNDARRKFIEIRDQPVGIDEDLLYPKDRRYHFIRGGRDFWIPDSVPLHPAPWMEETVRVATYPEDKFIEYGQEDDWWGVPAGYVRFERRPMAHVNILDITCPVTGTRTRCIYAHPDTIETIRQVHRVVPRPVSIHASPV